MNQPSALLLDIDGCVVEGIGRRALAGAVEAVSRLRRVLPIRFVTNTTSRTVGWLADSLRREGFDVADEELITPASLARKVLTARDQSRGLLLADESSMPDLGWFETTSADQARCVLLATEGHDRPVGSLQQAVVALMGGAKLYTLQQNRIYRRDGRVLTDLGPLAAFLGYAANVGWENLGKPSPLLFASLAEELGCQPPDLCMVGDDAEFDVAGALKAGVGSGVLVRTGKYAAGDEEKFFPRPTLTLDSIADLPDALG